MTPAEKQLRAKQRQEKNALIKMKLDSALLDVWKRAESLHEELGMYTIKHWYERLLQHSTKKKGVRATSRWNAFLSKEVRLRNEGVY